MLKPQNLVFLLLVTISLLYVDTVNSLYFLWMESGNPAYSHGALAFLIALYLFGKFWFAGNASSGSNTPIKLDVLGLLMLLGASVLWMLATLGNIQVIQQLAILGLVGFTFWAAFGFYVFQKLVVPLLIMLTTIPIWDFLDIYLQHITAFGVDLLLRITTIPFVKEGVRILLQSGTFEIADRCSGLRMVTAIVPVALLYCYQWKFRAWATLCYVLLAILIAIVANVIRIFIVVVAGHLTEMKHYFVTTDHVALGWIVFAIVVLLFIFISNKLLLSEKLYPRLSASPIQETTTVIDLENLGRSVSKTQGTLVPERRNFAVLLAIGLGIAVGPLLANAFSFSGAGKLVVPVEFSATYGKWGKEKDVSAKWTPKYHGQDFERLLQFKNEDGDTAQLYLAYYKYQEQGKEAVHFENKTFDSSVWKKFSDRLLRRNVPGIGVISLREIKIQSLTGQKKLIWLWYYVGRNRVNDPVKAKLYEILSKLAGNPAISVIMVAADVGISEKATEMLLTDFAQAIIAELETKLDLIGQ